MLPRLATTWRLVTEADEGGCRHLRRMYKQRFMLWGFVFILTLVLILVLSVSCAMSGSLLCACR